MIKNLLNEYNESRLADGYISLFAKQMTKYISLMIDFLFFFLYYDLILNNLQRLR